MSRRVPRSQRTSLGSRRDGSGVVARVEGGIAAPVTTLCRMLRRAAVVAPVRLAVVRVPVTVLLAVVVCAGLLLASMRPASAHVDFVGSDPPNVSTVAGPISTVTFEFSGPADPIASGFLIEDSAGVSLPIESVGTDGDNRVVVTSASPLPAGRCKVTWALRGTDGHRMTGTVSFTVTSTGATDPASSAAPTASNAARADTVAPAVASATPRTGDSETTSFADVVAAVGRWIVYGAILFVVGAFAYLVWVHRGTRREGRKIVFLIRRGALVVVFGAIIEWFAQLAVRGSGRLSDVFSPAAWGEVLTSGFAIGTLLRLVGGVLVLRFVSIDVVSEDPVDMAELDRVDDLDLVGDPSRGGGASTLAMPARTRALSRVRVESGPLAFLGVALLIVSESFIGHTASVEPRALVLASDAVHMAAAGVWVAGVWLLSWTLWQRRRRGEPLDARLLAVRFSLVATWALVAVALTGAALAWVILDAPGRLVSTQFGRVLLLKVVLVGVVALIGLHNRRSLLPHLESDTNGERFRRTILVESVLFVGVLLLTSLLVVSNPLS